MLRLSLIYWVKRWFWGAIITLSLFLLCLTVVNIVDAFPYWSALHRVKKLDEQSLRGIAAACTQHEKSGNQRLLGNGIPPEFRFLKPVRVSFYPGCTDISLWGSDDFGYVFLRVDTDPENQKIVCVSIGYDRQRSRTLWERNPEFTQRVNPKGRLVTLAQIDMHTTREWIVRSNELLVIDRRGLVGQADRVSIRAPLSLDQRFEIETAISSIGPNIRGHAFDSGGMDGVALHVSFTSDGSAADDVILANTWREELQPLVDAIIHILGPEAANDLQDTVRWCVSHSDHTEVTTLAERDHIQNFVPLPWWRLWPRFKSTSDI